MSEVTLPIMRPRLPRASAILPRLSAIDASGLYSNRGPHVRELEQRFAEKLGTTADRVVTVANATLGLMGALAISPQTHWVAPSWTFSATIAAAMQAGKHVSFDDVRAHDWWLDAPDTSCGVLSVAPFGSGVSVSAVDRERETVIDAAASLGAIIEPLDSLPAGAAIVFSLGATKVLGAGEGGIAVFGDAERARRFTAWTLLGFDGDRTSTMLGINARMSEYTAAVAHAALDQWQSERDEWRAAHILAHEAEERLGLDAAPLSGTDANPYWIILLHSAEERRRAEWALAQHGVDSRRWWGDGCHRQAAYAQLDRDALHVTEQLAERALGLPFSRVLARSEVARIEQALLEARFP
jgi:dTDP-4-amino-4,6-dideoxygalactose transaminase